MTDHKNRWDSPPLPRLGAIRYALSHQLISEVDVIEIAEALSGKGGILQWEEEELALLLRDQSNEVWRILGPVQPADEHFKDFWLFKDAEALWTRKNDERVWELLAELWEANGCPDSMNGFICYQPYREAAGYPPGYEGMKAAWAEWLRAERERWSKLDEGLGHAHRDPELL